MARARHQLKEERRNYRRVARNCDFAVYGLDSSWVGRRLFSGYAKSEDVIREVSLSHGDSMDPEGQHLRISTAPEHRSYEKWNERARDLAQHMLRVTQEETDELRAPFKTCDDDDVWWDRTNFIVDGDTVVFSTLTGNDHWVALGRHHGCLLWIVARRFRQPAVQLAAITDFEPYLADDVLTGLAAGRLRRRRRPPV